MAEADAGGSPGPDLPELQPRPRAQGHGLCLPLNSYTEVGSFVFCPAPSIFYGC